MLIQGILRRLLPLRILVQHQIQIIYARSIRWIFLPIIYKIYFLNFLVAYHLYINCSNFSLRDLWPPNSSRFQPIFQLGFIEWEILAVITAPCCKSPFLSLSKGAVSETVDAFIYLVLNKLINIYKLSHTLFFTDLFFGEMGFKIE